MTVDEVLRTSGPDCLTDGRGSLTVEEALPLALQLHQAGSFPEAETLYKRTLQSVPANLNALHYYGLLCLLQNRYNEAAELIHKSISLDPKNADAHNNLGNALRRCGDYIQAAETYKKAVLLNPEHAGPGRAKHVKASCLVIARRIVSRMPTSREWEPTCLHFS